jgi:hypothetical protein
MAEGSAGASGKPIDKLFLDELQARILVLRDRERAIREKDRELAEIRAEKSRLNVELWAAKTEYNRQGKIWIPKIWAPQSEPRTKRRVREPRV